VPRTPDLAAGLDLTGISAAHRPARQPLVAGGLVRLGSVHLHRLAAPLGGHILGLTSDDAEAERGHGNGYELPARVTSRVSRGKVGRVRGGRNRDLAARPGFEYSWAMAAPADDAVARLYDAFSRKDGPGMAACYAPSATFSDPVFRDLRGKEIGDMWTMLCETGKDLSVTARNIVVDGDRGRADWEARYTFSFSGRKVVNLIHAEFTLADGLIAKHRDQFDFWRWSRQALGPAGVLLGWTPVVQGRVRKLAQKSLRDWQRRRAEA
jgi:ketosteroid isomerase-like protein